GGGGQLRRRAERPLENHVVDVHGRAPFGCFRPSALGAERRWSTWSAAKVPEGGRGREGRRPDVAEPSRAASSAGPPPRPSGGTELPSAPSFGAATSPVLLSGVERQDQTGQARPSPESMLLHERRSFRVRRAYAVSWGARSFDLREPRVRG